MQGWVIVVKNFSRFDVEDVKYEGKFVFQVIFLPSVKT
jgi:hypothetical protein